MLSSLLTSFVTSLIIFDHWLFEQINQVWTNSLFDTAMPVITDLHHQALTPWLALLLLVLNGPRLYRHRQTAARWVVASILAFAISDLVSYRVIKPWADRDRPEKAGVAVTLRVSTHSGQSFPSNHAANAFAVANTLGLLCPPLRIGFLVVAGVVAYSRVYVGVHFPLDVIAGSLLGLMVSHLTWYLMIALVRLRDYTKCRWRSEGNKS